MKRSKSSKKSFAKSYSNGKKQYFDHVSTKSVLNKVIEANNSNGNPMTYDIDMFSRSEKIGEGASGKVYKAFNDRTKQTLVIKAISKQKGSILDVNQELKVLKYLQPYCQMYILCYDNFFEDDKFWFIVTEYLGNYITSFNLKLYKNLNNNANKNRLFNIIKNVYLGLKEIHKLGVVHRDVKPDNILVEDNGTKIKYIDFGFACINNKCAYTSEIRGTLIYMAPEEINILALQVIKKEYVPKNVFKQLDLYKVDIWALGFTIYELIIGKNPFDIWGDYMSDIGIKYGESRIQTTQAMENFYKTFKYLSGKVTTATDEYVESILSQITDVKISLKNMLAIDPKDRYL